MTSWSQFGEDVLLWKHFGDMPSGYFVEIGANHPTKFSQTWFFEQRGWRGLLVEPITAKCEQLRAGRPGSRVVQAAVGAPEQRGRAEFHVAQGDDMYSGLDVPATGTAITEDVEIRTLDDILDAEKSPRIDLLSVDVEGNELDVLKGFDIGRHRPRVVLLEDHLHSLEVHRWMSTHGYRLVRRTCLNNWYIPREATPPRRTLGERMKLFRKVFLGLPFRALRRWRHQHNRC